jgi:carboxynorspermidine decarboxylase
MHRVFPLLRTVLDGTCASSPWEARLGRELFGGHVTAFAAAYSAADIRALCTTVDHVIFNSFAQFERFSPTVTAPLGRDACGLRVNPRYSEVGTALYNPCAGGSRLGIPVEAFAGQSLDGVAGLHFHTLCEQNADVLERTLAVVEEQFGPWIRRMQWMNFGGGHHITRSDYDVDRLCRTINGFRERYPGVEVYLEPGEAVALDTGFLVCTVLDIVENQGEIAIVDASAAAHMPDVLEMPYRPRVTGAGDPGAKAYTYRLAGLSCLAGDVIGEYSFDRPLVPGDRLVFEDMAHYTMVKNTTFNGVQLPAICLVSAEDGVEVVREFGYETFRDRLS